MLKLTNCVTGVIAGCVLGLATLTYAYDVDEVPPVKLTSDKEITFTIKTNLAGEASMDMKHIIVTANGQGVVLLSGYAASQEIIDKAEDIARHTIGVNSVDNQIALKTR